MNDWIQWQTALCLCQSPLPACRALVLTAAAAKAGAKVGQQELHQDKPFPAEVGVTDTAFPLGMTAAERYFSVSIWQTSPAPSLPSSPEGAADQEGPRCRKTAGLLHPAGLEGGSLRCWDGDEWGVWLLSLGRSREGSWEKRHGGIHGWGGEKKSDSEIFLPCQASTAPWYFAFIYSELFRLHWPLVILFLQEAEISTESF